MEKGIIDKVSFLCMIVADVIVLCVIMPNIIGLNGYYNTRDPTFQEALQFTYSDQTDKNQYSQSYTCTNFASDFVNDATIAGYKCGYVEIEFPEINHAIVCFNTTDNGLIFIEPQNDELVVIATGQSYEGLTILGFSITWERPFATESLFILFLVIATLSSLMLAIDRSDIAMPRK